MNTTTLVVWHGKLYCHHRGAHYGESYCPYHDAHYGQVQSSLALSIINLNKGRTPWPCDRSGVVCITWCTLGMVNHTDLIAVHTMAMVNHTDLIMVHTMAMVNHTDLIILISSRCMVNRTDLIMVWCTLWAWWIVLTSSWCGAHYGHGESYWPHHGAHYGHGESHYGHGESYWPSWCGAHYGHVVHTMGMVNRTDLIMVWCTLWAWWIVLTSSWCGAHYGHGESYWPHHGVVHTMGMVNHTDLISVHTQTTNGAAITQ